MEKSTIIAMNTLQNKEMKKHFNVSKSRMWNAVFVEKRPDFAICIDEEGKNEYMCV